MLTVGPSFSSNERWSLFAFVEGEIFALVLIIHMPGNDVHLLGVGAFIFLGRFCLQIGIGKLVMSFIDGDERWVDRQSRL